MPVSVSGYGRASSEFQVYFVGHRENFLVGRMHFFGCQAAVPLFKKEFHSCSGVFPGAREILPGFTTHFWGDMEYFLGAREYFQGNQGKCARECFPVAM